MAPLWPGSITTTLPARPAVAPRALLDEPARVLGAELCGLVLLVVDLPAVDVLVGLSTEEVGLDRVVVADVGMVLGCGAGAAVPVSAAVLVVCVVVVGVERVDVVVVVVEVRAVAVAVVGAEVLAESIRDVLAWGVAPAGGTGRALGDVVIGVMGSSVRPALPAAATLDSSPGTVTITPAEVRDADVTTDVTRAVAEPRAGFDGL